MEAADLVVASVEMSAGSCDDPGVVDHEELNVKGAAQEVAVLGSKGELEAEVLAAKESLQEAVLLLGSNAEVIPVAKECALEATSTVEDHMIVDGDCTNGAVDSAVDMGKSIHDSVSCGAASPVVPPGDIIPLQEQDTSEPLWDDVQDVQLVEPASPAPFRPAKRPRIAPECVEVDDVVQAMRNILFNLAYEDDAHLNPEDELAVRKLLEYHPKSEEKTGCGIDHIKINRHSTFKDVRCFWVVRTDGTETDFSYHKCLKEKVARDHPSFVDRYDAVYRAGKARQG